MWNRGRHLYLPGRPSHWASAHILILYVTERGTTAYILYRTGQKSYSPNCASVHEIKYMYTPFGIRTSPVLPLLRRFEYIDRRTCPGIPGLAPFRLQNYPLHVWGSEAHLIQIPWCPPEYTSKRNLNQFSRLCTAIGKESLYFTMCRTFHPLNIALSHGDLDPI